MPASSKKQFKFFKLLENRPDLRKRTGMSESTVKEYTKSNTGKKAYKKLPERKK